MLRVRPDPIAYGIGENYRFLPEGHVPLLLMDNVGRTETFKPAQWVDYLAHEFPGIWQWYADEIEWRKGWKPWHGWCFCPSDTPAHFLGDDFEASRDWVWAIAGIVAWRATQGVYRFGEVLLEELLQTPIVGDIPVEHLQRLPEWCVYVELPRLEQSVGLNGFFAYLDDPPNENLPPLLCILFNEPRGLQPMIIPLRGTLESTLDHMKLELNNKDYNELSTDISGMISALLYLCSPDAELVPTKFKTHDKMRLRRSRKGPYLPAAKGLEVWNTGFSLSRSLQSGRAEGHQGGTVRGHIRRAHWHSFWVGTEQARRLDIRWLPPIRVNLDEPELVTIRNVKEQ